MPARLPRVFVVSRGSHDYSTAENHGELVFMTDESISSTDLSHMIRLLWPHLQTAEEGDFLLWSGLKNLNCVASMLFALRVNKPRILIYTGRSYVIRDLDLDQYKKPEAFTGPKW